MTRSPTVIVPALPGVNIGANSNNRNYLPLMTPWAARNIIAVSALENMIFWPEFRYARDVAIFNAAFSYDLRCLSY